MRTKNNGFVKFMRGDDCKEYRGKYQLPNDYDPGLFRSFLIATGYYAVGEVMDEFDRNLMDRSFTWGSCVFSHEMHNLFIESPMTEQMKEVFNDWRKQIRQLAA